LIPAAKGELQSSSELQRRAGCWRVSSGKDL
jgi:hypothetical protein